MDQEPVFRGNQIAKIDDKGRLKIPSAFRQLIQDGYGPEVFVTSVTGEQVLIYPMPIWRAREARLREMPSTHPARIKYLKRVNYFGQTAEIDVQGRVLIHPLLRDSAGTLAEVDVIGEVDCLQVWNRDRFRASLNSDPFTEADARALADFKV